jgi:hypothetical protein
LKCGAGEGWRRSAGLFMGEIKKYYLQPKSRGISLHKINKRKTNWIGHILLRNCLLRQIIEGKIKGEIEVTGRLGRRRMKGKGILYHTSVFLPFYK